MNLFQTLLAALLVLVAIAGTAVVATRDPRRQVFVAGVFGLLLAVLFFALHAPDVALSEIVVGTIALPLLVLTALLRVEGKR